MAGNFIAESSFSEGFVRRLNPSAKIHRMKNLIHPLYFQTGRKPVDSLRVILFVGRVTEEKGVFELLHAFAEIHDKHPEINLEFIGPIHDPLENAKLRVTVQELGLAEWVSFSGLQPVSYIAERLAEACMMAYPSYMDTSPNSIYEAMAVGAAVIGTRVGGIPDMVEDGVTGLLVQPRDSESLARAMNFLLDYPEENQRVGQNAKSAARAELESAQTIRNIKKLYMSLL
jgi:glycosyltransferase involved in cell wall biosynthesis